MKKLCALLLVLSIACGLLAFPAAAAGENLFRNGSLTGSITQWAAQLRTSSVATGLSNPVGTSGFDAQNGHDAPGCLFFDMESTGKGYVSAMSVFQSFKAENNVSLKPATKYSVSFWAKLTGLESFKVNNFKLTNRTNNNTLYSDNKTFSITGGDWTKYTFVLTTTTITEDTNDFMFIIQMGGDQKTNFQLYLDDFTLTELSGDMLELQPETASYSRGENQIGVRLTNSTPKEFTAKPVAALYEADRLISVSEGAPVTLASGAEEVTNVAVTVGDEVDYAASEIRLFCFDSWDTLVPLAAAATLRPDTAGEARGKWKEYLTGSTSEIVSDPDVQNRIDAINQDAQSQWDQMVKTPGRTYLWEDQKNVSVPNKEGSTQLRDSFNRLRQMAVAYSTAGGSLFENQQLGEDIVSGVNLLYQYYDPSGKTLKPYGAGTEPGYGNWFHWQIAIPMALNDIMTMMYDDFSREDVQKIVGGIFQFCFAPEQETASNAISAAKVCIVGGMLSGRDDMTAKGVEVLKREIKYVTLADGFHMDGSFLFHGFYAYNGGYGADFIGSVRDMAYLVSGTENDITDEQKAMFGDWFTMSFEPLIYDGAMMDMVRGRAVARPTGSTVASGLILDYLSLADVVGGEEGKNIKSRIKYWVQQAGLATVKNAGGLFDTAKLLELMNDASIPSAPKWNCYKTYPVMDRATASRASFGFGLAMNSSRTYIYECLNEENYQGWYTSDGMTYLYNADRTQYTDGFWATVNRYRLPGTTVDTLTRQDGSGTNTKGNADWVGGVTPDGVLGSNGMELRAFDADGNEKALTAKKSWFVFDDEIVCLGSDIRSDEGRVIETTVENRKISGDNAVTVNGVSALTEAGQETQLTDVRWAHLAGNSPSGSDIGYYFPQAAGLKAIRESRTDSWRTVNTNTGITDDPVTRNFFTMWYDHGTNPDGAGYQYVLLPGKTAAEVDAYAQNPDVQVIETSAEAHAARDTSTNTLAVNFWNDASKTVAGVTCDKKASVMVKETGGVLTVAVSDPTQKNTGKITVELDRQAAELIEKDSGVTVVELGPKVKLEFNVSGLAGGALTVSLSMQGE